MKLYLYVIFLFATYLTWGQQKGIAHIPMPKNCTITISIQEQNECAINSINTFLAKQIPLTTSKEILAEDLKTPVKIQLHISENGEIYKFKSDRLNNKLLEKAIQKALTDYTFIPATSNDGKTHKSTLTFYYKSTIIDRNITATPFYYDFDKSPNNVTFRILQSPITLNNCQQKNSLSKQYLCTNTLIAAHVSKNFNTDMLPSLHLRPGKQKIYAMFTVNLQGKIKDIQVRAPHKKLKEEALRIIKLLPKLKPAIFNGQPISQKFSLPIKFNVI